MRGKAPKAEKFSLFCSNVASNFAYIFLKILFTFERQYPNKREGGLLDYANGSTFTVTMASYLLVTVARLKILSN